MEQIIADPGVASDIIQFVVGPVLVALVAAIPYIYKAVVKYRTNKLQSKVEDTFKLSIADISLVYHIMRTLMTHVPSINRTMIIKSHNGGGIPSPKTPVYLTALHEVALMDTTPMLEDVQCRPVDAFHANHILTPLASTGTFHINKQTNEGFLKDIYEAYNHEWSKGIVLAIDETAMTYLVVAFRGGATEDLTPIEREKMNAAVTRITNIIKKY